jgi:hypothetical protein
MKSFHFRARSKSIKAPNRLSQIDEVGEIGIEANPVTGQAAGAEIVQMLRFENLEVPR